MTLAFAGLWLEFPWWTSYIGLMLTIALLLLRLSRSRWNVVARWPAGRAERYCVGTALVVSLIALFALVESLRGRSPPRSPVAIASPLGPGTYLAANAGYRPLINAHLETLETPVERMKAFRGQSYGIDLVQLGPLGLRAQGWQPESPTAYVIFGAPVIAPCEGRVRSSRRDLPDLPIPKVDKENLAGNYVLIDCVGFSVLLAHLQHGSVSLTPGDIVKTGQAIGRVGNSGNSAEPHLHIHAQEEGTAQQPLSGNPLPITIEGVRMVRNSRLHILAPPLARPSQ